MKYKRNVFKKWDYIIIILSIILTLSIIYINKSGERVKDNWHEEKIQAATLMDECLKEIKKEKLKRKIPIDKRYDINETGIIGAETSSITTTIGALEAKRTTTNPDFAALIVHMMKKLNLKDGDSVCINLSGSFPALNIAVMSSCEVLKLKPIVIASFGASTWGANNPDFTYLDMEEVLYKKKFISNRADYVSIGGASDLGNDMDDDYVKKIVNRVEGYGRNFITENNLKDNIERRWQIYNANNDRIKAFINVGGNIVSLGETLELDGINPGIIKNTKVKVNEKTGLIQLFLSKDIPVIHLLNIKKIAVDYGIPVDPVTIPKIGTGNIYYSFKHSYKFSVITLMIAIIVIIVYGNKMRSKYE